LLGSIYENGRGVPANESEATKWYRLAAEQGCASAQVNLGDMYFNGRTGEVILSPSDRESVDTGFGVPRYYAQAVTRYRLAANQGYPPAHTRLSFMYTNGLGVPQDSAEAVRLNRLAAEKGYAPAQYGLGTAYYGGHGVFQDFAEAANWFQLAAEQGEGGSQLALAHMYRNGEGLAEDYVRSFVWLSLAASGLLTNSVEESHKPKRYNDAYDDLLIRQLADSRRELKLLLSVDELAEADRLVREWKAKT
jgi:TPR repeat protein